MKPILAFLAAATLLLAHSAAVAADAPKPTAKESASASSACEDRAIDKNGKKLAGAARTSFLKKCESELAAPSCEDRAIDKNGKKLAGAARASFVKKCEAESAKSPR